MGHSYGTHVGTYSEFLDSEGTQKDFAAAEDASLSQLDRNMTSGGLWNQLAAAAEEDGVSSIADVLENS